MNKNLDENKNIKILKRNSFFSIFTDKTIDTKSTDDLIINNKLPNTHKKKTLLWCIPLFKKNKIVEPENKKNKIVEPKNIIIESENKTNSIKLYFIDSFKYKNNSTKYININKELKDNLQNNKEIIIDESENNNCNSKTNSLKYFSDVLKDDSIKCKNMNIQLKDLLKDNSIINEELKENLQNNIIDLVDDWSKPPEKYGLENSERIFGQYYLTNQNLNGKIFNIDFLYTIIDDIRNYRKLSKYQLSFINNIDHETKFMIINEFNNSLNVLVNSYE